MSAREFKPGDVAMVSDEFGSLRVAVHGGMNPRMKHHWHYDEAGIGRILVPRPLVVIDPEDREQVERLADALGACIADTEATLRDLADPKPRIEEPTGLGAVVEDADGQKWVRTDVDGPAWSEWGHAIGRWHFSKINAVRVLSPGWSK